MMDGVQLDAYQQKELPIRVQYAYLSALFTDFPVTPPLQASFDLFKYTLEGNAVGCEPFSQSHEVFLLEGPIVQPFLHHIYEFDDAFGLEVQCLVQLPVFLLVGVVHLQHEVTHATLFLLNGKGLVVDEVLVDCFEGVFEGGDDGVEVLQGKGLILEAVCQLVGLQIDGVFVYFGLDLLVLLTGQLDQLVLLLILHVVQHALGQFGYPLDQGLFGLELSLQFCQSLFLQAYCLEVLCHPDVCLLNLCLFVLHVLMDSFLLAQQFMALYLEFRLPSFQAFPFKLAAFHLICVILEMFHRKCMDQLIDLRPVFFICEDGCFFQLFQRRVQKTYFLSAFLAIDKTQGDFGQELDQAFSLDDVRGGVVLTKEVVLNAQRDDPSLHQLSRIYLQSFLAGHQGGFLCHCFMKLWINLYSDWLYFLDRFYTQIFSHFYLEWLRIDLISLLFLS